MRGREGANHHKAEQHQRIIFGEKCEGRTGDEVPHERASRQAGRQTGGGRWAGCVGKGDVWGGGCVRE